jgi:hypothetical protein
VFQVRTAARMAGMGAGMHRAAAAGPVLRPAVAQLPPQACRPPLPAALCCRHRPRCCPTRSAEGGRQPGWRGQGAALQDARRGLPGAPGR